jgi:micrococcal nuclease
VDRIRLAGITAPDPQQVPWGEVAQTCLNDQVRNQLVRVEPSDPDVDAYGRLWAYVWRGDRAVNATLLAEGCAYLDTDHLPQNPYADAWIYAQEEGRLLGRGIWDPAQPLRQTPEAFRQSQPAAAPASSP